MTVQEIYDLLIAEALAHGAAIPREACRRFMLKKKYKEGEKVKRKPLTPTQRTKLYAMQRGRCAGCGERFDPNKLEDDHFDPVAHGGSNDFRNRQLLCKPCNREKSDKLPLEQAKATGDTILEQLQKRGCRCHETGPHDCPIHGDHKRPPVSFPSPDEF